MMLLLQQMKFLREIDYLKVVVRQTFLLDQSRQENDAEHSWHLAMMAIVLVDYANEPVDLSQVIKMVLVHDLVEIDAGDTYIYDEAAARDKAAREQRAADRIFGLLPPPQAAELRALWDEFEAQQTPEAAFALSIDRLQPLVHNYYTQGRAWQQHGIVRDQVLQRLQVIERGSAVLWDYAQQLINDAVKQGYLAAGPDRHE